MRRFPRLSICGVPVDNVTRNQLLETFVLWTRPNQRQRHVCYLNAHVHNLARKDTVLRDTLDRSDLCYADGMSIVWASRLLGGNLATRLTAADFLTDMIGLLSRTNRRIYLLGGKPGVVDRTVDTLQRQVPGFAPVGRSHGYVAESDTPAMVRDINRCRPDLLIVGMGSPRQELWIAENRHAMNVPLIWSVGAAFDYEGGVERRCPQWMGDCGMEWLFRLAMNPRRMASRYLIGNPSFVCSVLLSRLQGRSAT